MIKPIIAEAIRRKQDRVRMACSMVQPIRGWWGPYPPAVADIPQCEHCALGRHQNCEEIRPNRKYPECKVPEGLIFTWDEIGVSG